MKKISFLLVLAGLGFIVFQPAITKAEDSNPESTATPSSIRERLRTDSRIQSIKANVKNNEAIREDLIKRGEGLRLASTSATSSRPGGRENEPGDDRGQNRGLNSDKDQGRNMKALERIHRDIFEMQKKHLVQELNKSLKNLNQIRQRIQERITKAEAAGRTMTAAKAALVIADAKLSAAKTAVDALAALTPQFVKNASTTVATTTATSTTTTTSPQDQLVDLTKPRIAGAAAIKAVNDAKKALNDVVIAIAHAMGFKIGNDGKIEDSNPTPVPSISPSSTPTPSSSATPIPSVTPTSSATPTATATPTPTI